MLLAGAVANTMYCLPLCMNVIGTALVRDGIFTAPTCLPCLVHRVQLRLGVRRPAAAARAVDHQRLRRDHLRLAAPGAAGGSSRRRTADRSSSTGSSWPPFGIHQALSPVFMLYAVMPPSSFGLTIDTPPMLCAARRVAKPPPHALAVARACSPAAAAARRAQPQLSCGEL